MAFDDADALVFQRRPEDAVALLRTRGEAGDAGAFFKLAEWSREGRLIPRDLTAARECYGRAGEGGIERGEQAYIAYLCLGVGGPRDWPRALERLAAFAQSNPLAARQLRLLESMSLTDDGDPVSIPKRESLSDTLRIWSVPGLFTDAECDYLVEAALPHMMRAQTIDKRTGRHFVNGVRTSDSAGFPWVGEDPAVHALNRRIAAATGTTVQQGEPLQILRYRVGQQFMPHFDAVPGWENQRFMTALVYLNEGYGGGETRFLEAGVEYKGSKGDALVFVNVDEAGEPDRRTMHEGCPVTSGEKLLASRWIRAKSIIE